MRILLLFLMISGITMAQADEKLPFYEVTDYPETYTAGTVAARMVEGLGFRFHWSSEGLTEKDLAYRPSDEVRSTSETIDHILDLSYIIVNATLKKENSKIDNSNLSYDEKRRQTLLNLQTASEILRKSTDLSEFDIIFSSGTYPFWNNINGPIADALWHCGQLASFRRSSGNPINPKISHFTGTIRE